MSKLRRTISLALVLWVSLTLALPSPARALRSIQSQQNPEITRTIAAGLEEDDLHWEIISDTFWTRFFLKNIFEYLADDLSISTPQLVAWMAKQSVLDLGTGADYSVVRWLRANGATQAYGMDAQLPQGIEAKDPNLVRMKFQDHPWPFADQQFRFVMNIFSLGGFVDLAYPDSWKRGHLQQDYRIIASELRRVLSSDGLVLIGIEMPEPPLELALQEAGLRIDRKIGQHLIVTKAPLGEVLAKIAREAITPAGMEEQTWDQERIASYKNALLRFDHEFMAILLQVENVIYMED